MNKLTSFWQPCWVQGRQALSGSSVANTRNGRFGSKVGQIGPKWDKSGAFSDQISVHLAREPRIRPIWATLTHFGAKPTIPGQYIVHMTILSYLIVLTYNGYTPDLELCLF